MTSLRLAPDALARSRFAISPLAETLGTAITLHRPAAPQPWLHTWHARHRPAFRAALDADPFADGLLGLLSTTKWLPRYVASPPTGGLRTALDDELAAVAATPDAEIRAGFDESAARSWEPQDVAAWAGGRHGLGPATAEVLRRVWTDHVAPEWPRRRAVLDREITHRAGLLAAHGWPRALERMSRHSAWTGPGTIRFSSHADPDRDVGAAGMEFVPVTVTGGTWLCEGEDGAGRYALVYPARGAAADDGPPGGAAALARLLGTGRAAVLHALARPATGSELAAELGLALGTVGGHLAVLRDAGLVARARAGRRVVYARTGAGETVVRAAG